MKHLKSISGFQTAQWVDNQWRGPKSLAKAVAAAKTAADNMVADWDRFNRYEIGLEA